MHSIEFIVILNCNNIAQYYCFYCIFEQINEALVSIRYILKKIIIMIYIYIYIYIKGSSPSGKDQHLSNYLLKIHISSQSSDKLSVWLLKTLNMVHNSSVLYAFLVDTFMVLRHFSIRTV